MCRLNKTTLTNATIPLLISVFLAYKCVNLTRKQSQQRLNSFQFSEIFGIGKPLPLSNTRALSNSTYLNFCSRLQRIKYNEMSTKYRKNKMTQNDTETLSTNQHHVSKCVQRGLLHLKWIDNDGWDWEKLFKSKNRKWLLCVNR